MAWRFMLQDALSGEFIDLDVPLSDVSITKAINAPGAITGNIPFEYATLRKSNDNLALREWGTILHAEEDGRIVQSAIVDQISLENGSLTVDAGGFSMLANEIPWLGATKNYIEVDPLTVFRDIWNHVQSYADADLGIVVDGVTSKVRVGTPEDPKLTLAKAREEQAQKKVNASQSKLNGLTASLDTNRKAVFVAAGFKAAGQIFVTASAPSGTKRNKANLWLESDQANKGHKFNGTSWVDLTLTGSALTNFNSKASAYLSTLKDIELQKTVIKKDKESLKAATDVRKTQAENGEAEPFRLAWYETDNVQTVIDELAESTPFQYQEHSYWSGDTIKYQLKLGQPSIGARRPQARFEIGVNVQDVPTISISDYASEALVFGAGEGSKKIRSTATINSDRLRRVKLLTDKDLTTTDRASRSARSLLRENDGSRDIDSLTVFDHPLAPFGTYEVGDEVRVVGDTGWQRDFDQWVRILDMTITPDTNTISMKVEVV